MLPTDSDFYGLTDRPYQGTALPEEAAAQVGPVLPIAHEHGARAVEIVVGGARSEVLDTTRSSARHLEAAWRRWGIVSLLKTATEAPPPREGTGPRWCGS